MAKIMCPHCASPNLDTDPECYDCGKSLGVEQLKGKLPDGFPGKAALVEAGYDTYAKTRKLHESGELTSVLGIGEATASSIEEALVAE